MKKSYNDEIENDYGLKIVNDNITSLKQTFVCIDKDGYYLYPSLANLRRGIKIRRFAVSNPNTVENIKHWLNINNKSFKLVSKEYNGNSKKLTLMCNIHKKEFYTNWNGIYLGRGCPLCCTDGKKERYRHSDEQVINDFMEVHGEDRYDYSLMKYVNNRTKIKIKCNECSNVFKMQPDAHKSGQKCPKCAKKLQGKWGIRSKEELLNAFNKVHKNKFIYDLSNYIDSSSKIDVICPIHGNFKTTSAMHMTGRDCYLCSRELTGWSKSRWLKAGSKSRNFDLFKVYFIRCWNENESFYKIGRTFQKISKRFHCKTDMPYNYELLKIIESNNGEKIYNLEYELHRLHNKNNLKYMPEIYFPGMFECYSDLLIKI